MFYVKGESWTLLEIYVGKLTLLYVAYVTHGTSVLTLLSQSKESINSHSLLCRVPTGQWESWPGFL